MKRKRAEVKAELLKQAEVLIDELLEWNAQTKAPDLTQIEEVVLKLRKQLGEQMALAVIDAQDSQRPSPGPHCPTCQCEMHYKDVKANTVESRVGSLSLQRGYYYCSTCRTGLFPPR
ncbi:MAG TPA: hypothetical protein VIV15_10535 [Anaerolineales bacterium]